jgi:rare lipoprotein A
MNRPGRRFGPQTSALLAIGFITVTLTGCHHRTTVAYQPPPPSSGTHRPAPDATTFVNIKEEAANAPAGFFDDTRGKPVFTEEGTASWYGTVYHNHPGADGTIFDQNAMTAAHRTLPMGSTVRVTNLATGQQVLVRITDRGPFSPSRVLDLSMGAAKAVGIYRAGVARVRVEAFAHESADPPGRWCVQTGAFKSEGDALALKAGLLKRYDTAKVTEFSGPTGFWVRIDPAQHSKAQASEIADWIGTPDPSALPYLLRLD